MGFHRAALLSTMAMSFMTGAMLCRPVYAEEGELIAQESTAQINVRSLANTQADIVAAGAVGDRVQILEHSVGNDGLIWYRVKLVKLGETGWIRGDLIKILGSVTPKSAEKSASRPKEPAQSAPVPLAPPKPPASAKSLAPSAPPAKPTVSQPANQPTSQPAVPPSNWGGAEISAATPTKSPAVSAENSATTIITFQTSTYAVRVFSKSGQLRLNLFNRKTKAIALSAVPVESKNSGEGTTYSYQSDVKVTVLIPTSGQPTLSAAALGETLKEKSEQSESSPAPSAPEASSSGTPTPAPSAPTPAPSAPASPAPAP
jgi:Bacterial SH3 domain